jgi:hypothetical protein
MTKTSTPTGAQTYSLYKNVTSASPKQISLAEIFQLITGDATLDAKTLSYRRLLEVGSPAAAQAKRDMPAFIVSANCPAQRGVGYITGYTGSSLRSSSPWPTRTFRSI